MNIIPPGVVPAKRRVHRKRQSPATTTPPVGELSIVAVGNVQVDGPQLTCTVFFLTTPEEPLTDVSVASPFKWFVRFEGMRFMGNFIQADSYESIQLTMEFVGNEPGENVIEYTNAPSDIFDTLGRQLPAIAGQAF